MWLSDISLHAIAEKLRETKNKFLSCFSLLKDIGILYALFLWERWQPKLKKLMQAFLAIFTAANTFKISVQVAPIVLSVINVLAAAPLFSFVVPQFFYTPAFLLPIVLGISLFAGYYKYTELVLRAKLDATTEANKKDIEELKSRFELEKATFESSLHKLEGKISVLEKRASPPILTIYDNLNNDDDTEKKKTGLPSILPPSFHLANESQAKLVMA